jgi:Xaa-Pro aminopeptidase
MSRLQALRDVMTDAALDAVLITHPANRRYVSGFSANDHGPTSSAGVLLVSRDEALLLTSPTNAPWAAAEAPGFDVVPTTRLLDELAKRLQASEIRRLGFEEESILYAMVQSLTGNLDGATELCPLEGNVTKLRAIKDSTELATIERAVQITDVAFEAVQASIRPGMRERDVAWAIERELRDAGADGIGFPPIVASGPHAARPHHAPTERPIESGEPVIIDMGGLVGGYTADLTRTICVGEADARFRSVYNVVHRAQEAAFQAIRAGITGADADRAARMSIESAGFADGIIHSLGHGIGLAVHEAPSASPIATAPLRAGELLTVEPGVYIPGWGGVRIEDVVVIQEHGCRVLTRAAKAPLFQD